MSGRERPERWYSPAPNDTNEFSHTSSTAPPSKVPSPPSAHKLIVCMCSSSALPKLLTCREMSVSTAYPLAGIVSSSTGMSVVPRINRLSELG